MRKSKSLAVRVDALDGVDLRLHRRWANDLLRHHARPRPLPLVWSSAWCRVWPVLRRSSARQHAANDPVLRWFFLGHRLAAAVQRDMDRGAGLYHGSRHAADVLITMSHLLRIWRDATGRETPPWQGDLAAACLMAALVHDWGHDGRPAESSPVLEEHSVTLLRRFFVAQPGPLDEIFFARLGRLIRSTHARAVPLVHQTWLARSMSLRGAGQDAPAAPEQITDAWASVLLSEADIAASLLPAFGLTFTRLLLQEQARWLQQAPHDNQVTAFNLYRTFLHQACISSPCAERLGLNRLIRIQKLRFP